MNVVVTKEKCLRETHSHESSTPTCHRKQGEFTVCKSFWSQTTFVCLAEKIMTALQHCTTDQIILICRKKPAAQSREWCDHKSLIFIGDENDAELKLWLLPSCSESCSTPPNRVSEIEIIHWLWLMCHADMLCPSFQPENDICRSLSRAIMTGSKHVRLSRGVNDQNVV